MDHWNDDSIPYGHKWALEFEAFKKDAAFQTLTSTGREFIEVFIRELRGREVRSNDKNAVCAPFTSGLKHLLNSHGFQPDSPARSIVIAGVVPKTADISFTFQSTSYVIEIKTKLEFASLGAAVLEAMAFKNEDATTHFSLIALYAFDSAACHAREILRECGDSSAFDSISILTRNKDSYDGTWGTNLAAAINELIAALPVE